MLPVFTSAQFLLLIALASPAAADALPQDLQPPGPHFPLTAEAHQATETFAAGRPIVGATYFYWYDVYSGAHIRDPDGTDALTTHPPAAAMQDLSYKSAIWHYSQLLDIREAGLDFIMPVFWGVPGRYNQWSITGLPPLIAAHDRMLSEREANPSRPAPPKIGLFYDTSTLQYNTIRDNAAAPGEPVDLTTDSGRRWFYLNIRDFFSMIPPGKWARVDGKPIVFLYGAGFAKAVDDKVFDDTRQRFRADFGIDLFLVREQSWPGHSDAWYRWGGALGLIIGDGVAALGPGYDHSAVPGRQALVVPREGGLFYARQWERLLRMNPARRPWMVHVETWNEWHEGTDIARSAEYGDQYIKATAHYAARLGAGEQLEPSGPFANAERVRWSGWEVGGLELVPPIGDGKWEKRTVDGTPAIVTLPSKADAPAAFAYFRVDDSYLFDESGTTAELTVVFREDGGCDQFRVEYDTADETIGVRSGAFRPTEGVGVYERDTWRTVKLLLPDVRFIDRANGADLRLTVTGGRRQLILREVILRKLPGTAMPTATRADGNDG